MPIRRYKCPLCGYERDSMRKEPKCNHNQEEEGTPYPVSLMEEVLVAPSAKMLEPRDHVAKEMGKSTMKDANKILKERARSHSRDNELDQLIQTNDRKTAEAAKWLKADGTRRKKIDDL